MDMFGNWGEADLNSDIREVIEEKLRLRNEVVDSAEQISRTIERIERSDRGHEGNPLYHLFSDLSTMIIGNPIPVGEGAAYVLGSQVMQDPDNTDQEIRVYTPVYVDLGVEEATVFPFGQTVDYWHLSQRDATINLLEQAQTHLRSQRRNFNEDEGRVLVFPENTED